MIERGRIDPRRLAVIPNGVDMSRFENAIPVSRESIGVADAALMILYVGRLDPQKNVDALIDLACEMSLGPREIAFVMVGDGPDSSRLRTRAEELPAGRPAFHWLGRREDVAALLATADIAVLPSHWEGMPNFALEAMAAGKPMIVNAFEGADEVIRDGETGWICRLSTPTGVARFRDLVAMAATSPHELAMVGAAARLDVARRFAPAATIAQYQELWNRVLAACAKRPVEPV
jgi:starch synthase (maltosyl-transferring)